MFNTCAVRENADNKLYGNLGQLAPVKAPSPGMQIAVGGCLAQKDRDTITTKAPGSTSCSGPTTSARCRAPRPGAVAEEAQVEILESLSVFPSTLPTRRESAYAAWVSVSVGCNNTCTFCIVPALRGKEKDRRPGEILAEIEALVAEGVTEITLLGQNVNAYGVEFGDRQAFSKLLRACGEIEGSSGSFHLAAPGRVHRRRHRGHGRDAQRDAELQMPLQSGSDRVLRRCGGPTARRSASGSSSACGGDARCRDHDRHHRGLPRRDRGGLPGHAGRRPRGAVRGAFTFQYSNRPGTPAATLDDQIAPDVVKDRYLRLAAVVDEVAWARARRSSDAPSSSWSPRARARTQPPSGCRVVRPDNRLVHFAADSRGPDEGPPGDMVTSWSPTPLPTTSWPTAPSVRTPHARRRRVGAPQLRARPRPASGSGCRASVSPPPLPPAPACG